MTSLEEELPEAVPNPVFTDVELTEERGRDILDMTITPRAQCGKGPRYRLTDPKVCDGSMVHQLQEVKATLENTTWSEASFRDTAKAHFGRSDSPPRPIASGEPGCLDCVTELGKRLTIRARKIEIIAT